MKEIELAIQATMDNIQLDEGKSERFVESFQQRQAIPCVYVCSRLRGDVAINLARARAVVACLAKASICRREHRGSESRQVIQPLGLILASHVMYMGMLEDERLDERQRAMELSDEMIKRSSDVVVVIDTHGDISEGMRMEIAAARYYNCNLWFAYVDEGPTNEAGNPRWLVIA